MKTDELIERSIGLIRTLYDRLDMFKRKKLAPDFITLRMVEEIERRLNEALREYHEKEKHEEEKERDYDQAQLTREV